MFKKQHNLVSSKHIIGVGFSSMVISCDYAALYQLWP